MEVDITFRVDFEVNDIKEFFLETLKKSTFQIMPNSFKSLNRKSLELSWCLYGSNWDDELRGLLDVLFMHHAIAAFGVVWGDDGWYELWSRIHNELTISHDWGGEELNDVFDELDNYMPMINKIRSYI